MALLPPRLGVHRFVDSLRESAPAVPLVSSSSQNLQDLFAFCPFLLPAAAAVMAVGSAVGSVVMATVPPSSPNLQGLFAFCPFLLPAAAAVMAVGSAVGSAVMATVPSSPRNLQGLFAFCLFLLPAASVVAVGSL